MTTLTIRKKDGTEAEQQASTAQTPAGLHGSHSLNGIRMVAPQVDLAANINPATGEPYVQIMQRPPGGMISPPPSRRFDGRTDK
jgi:hypothetical protein